MKRAVATLLLLATLVLVAVVSAQVVQPEQLAHRIKQRQSICLDKCNDKRISEEKCSDFCSKFVAEQGNIDDIVSSIEAEQVEVDTVSTLSEQSEAEKQEEANNQLYILFHRALRELLAGGAANEGFQVLDNAIELTDITSQIPGWDQRPIQDIERQIVQDYDNPAVLGEELILASKPGPIRDTNDRKIVEEYKSFLSGIEGVAQMQVPNPEDLPSAKRTAEYQDQLAQCAERYFMSPPFILTMFTDMEKYIATFCRGVKLAEDTMLRQIGVEQYQAGNNPLYGAAVALGMAQSLYTDAIAFKKFHNFRGLELECLKADQEGRAIQGIQRSLSFNYNYQTWKHTQETLKWKKKKGGFLFKKTIHYTKVINTNFDATSLGGVEIEFADYRSVPVYPGNWFSRSAFRDFRHKPRIGSSPIGRFFGEDGSLTLIPKTLHIVVNPKIAFWVDNAKKEEFKEESRKVVTGGFSVFGFGIKSSKDHQVKIEEGSSSNGKTKITISTSSCKPQLFAIDNEYNY